MKIIIDNNIIRYDNIEKIKKTNILKKVKNGEMTFYACAKIFSQLIPFLRYKCHKRKNRREVIDFLFKFINKHYMFPSIAEIANKEISIIKTNNFIDEFWLDKYNKEKIRNIRKNLSLINCLDTAIAQEKQDFTSEDIKNAHNEIKNFQVNNEKLIQNYCKNSFESINDNIRTEVEKWHFNEETIQSLIGIVRNIDSTNSNKNEQKKIIYTNLFDKLLEFNLLMNFKNQITSNNKQILIKDIDYINTYYENYNQITFTKLLIEATKYGYSYKVKNPNKSYDEDWVNDTSYICCATFVDVLLTNDTKYLKDAFKYIWGENKKIMTLDEFIKTYC
ncbi:MAG: hypothetical protein LKG27_00565 [Clostridiaceae bacterium]|jgi:hypothetical protein|nr:hypothetical protein [Clostridiaceae bacterium]